MTTVLQVQDASVLDHMKGGDKILFNGEKVDGACAVTRLEPAK